MRGKVPAGGRSGDETRWPSVARRSLGYSCTPGGTMHRAIVGVLSATFLPAFVASQASWSQLYPAVSPPPRSDAAMVCYEYTGDVLLLFGSPNSTPFRLQGDV